MSESDRPVPELRLDQRQSLSASWLLRLVREAGYDVPQTSLSTAPFIIGRPDDFHITVTPQDKSPWITAVSSDQCRQEVIDEVVKRSGELASGALVFDDDFGGLVWYTCTLAGEPPNLADPMFQSRMLEMLSTRVRISQWVRLSEYVLLNFREEVPEGGVQEDNVLFLPRPLIDVYVAVPGPIDGPFTRPIAHAFMEVIAAVCTFALGRPVNLPPTVWPVRDEMLAELESRRTDMTIQTLARHGIALDMLFHLVALGDRDSWQRLRGDGALVYDTPKTKGSRRRVPLMTATTELLRDYLADHPRRDEPTAPLFCAVTLKAATPTGKPATDAEGNRIVPTALDALAALSVEDAAQRLVLDWSALLRHQTFYKAVFRPAVLRANRRGGDDQVLAPGLKFHALRHTYASLCVAAGIPPLQLSRFMGHAKVTTTLAIYTHLFDDDHAETMAALEAMSRSVSASNVVPIRRARQT